LDLSLVTYTPKTPPSSPEGRQQSFGKPCLCLGGSVADGREACCGAAPLGAPRAEAGRVEAQLPAPSPELRSLCSGSSCAARRGSEGSGVRSCRRC